MDEKELNEKRIMHIDTSGKLYEKGTSGIAYKIIGSGLHKGLALSVRFKKELEKRLMVNRNYAKLYAICIYYLIKESLDLFDVLVICVDENFLFVKGYLNILFKGNEEYMRKDIISIHQLRKFVNNKFLISLADGVANSYRRRGLRNVVQKQKGLALNCVKITFNDIKDKWYTL